MVEDCRPTGSRLLGKEGIRAVYATDIKQGRVVEVAEGE